MPMLAGELGRVEALDLDGVDHPAGGAAACGRGDREVDVVERLAVGLEDRVELLAVEPGRGAEDTELVTVVAGTLEREVTGLLGEHGGEVVDLAGARPRIVGRLLGGGGLLAWRRAPRSRSGASVAAASVGAGCRCRPCAGLAADEPPQAARTRERPSAPASRRRSIVMCRVPFAGNEPCCARIPGPRASRGTVLADGRPGQPSDGPADRARPPGPRTPTASAATRRAPLARGRSPAPPL